MDTRTPFPILSPKLQIPPSRLQLVSRERLLRGLNEGVFRKLTVISAPAGYGKTTLLSEWAAQCEWRLGWITLAEGDNDTDRFLTYLVAAIQTAAASFSGLESILGTRFPLQPMPADALLAILVNQLSSLVERLVIVVDDYHHIDNQQIHGFLIALLENLPANIHIMISSRSAPPLRLARLRAKDQLNEITERDLRFNLAETSAFFESVVGLQLTHDQLAELEMRTEGWITGLQLAGLSLKDRQHPTELIKSLSGTHRYILDYLAEEVFSGLPSFLQAFLLRVSILERLSPDLCDAVVGSLVQDEQSDLPHQSRQILEFMDASNLFVVPLDSQRQWYRFHPLFSDFLRDRLRDQHAGELPDLHRRAASWYAEHDMLSEAVQHSFDAGDPGLAADLIQTQAKALLGRGEISTLLRWIGLLSEETIIARPQLGLARAWAMLMREPLRFLDTIDRQTLQIAQGFGIAVEDLLTALVESEPNSPRRSGLGEFAMLIAFSQRDSAQITQTINLFEAALQYLPESELLLRAFTLAGLASTYARSGAIKAAEQAFTQAAHISITANSLYGYVVCTDWQATMQAEQGQLKRAADTYKQAIDTLSSQSQSRYPLPLSGHVYVGLASVLLEWNDLEGALASIQTGLQVGIQVRDFDALLEGDILQARIFQALGENEKAMAAMQSAEQRARDTKSANCLNDTLAHKAHVALAAGDIAEVRHWASARGLGQAQLSELDHPLQEIEYYAYARLLMAEGKPAEALLILNEMVVAQQQMGRMRSAIETQVLQSLCLRSLGQIDDAQRILARAMLFAEPEGFVRVFIQEGHPLAVILRSAASKGHSPEYVKNLLGAIGSPHSIDGDGLDPLSEREVEVLSLMANGLTNTEIAAELVIAVSTVKTHINRIYSKLGVSSRTQAVVQARQLQLIP